MHGQYRDSPAGDYLSPFLNALEDAVQGLVLLAYINAAQVWATGVTQLHSSFAKTAMRFIEALQSDQGTLLED